MRDGDGNRVYFGSSLPYENFLDEDSRALRTGVLGRGALPESRRSVLRYFIKHPGRTVERGAMAMGVTSIDSRVTDFVAIGYLKFVRRAKKIKDSCVEVTSAGIDAFNREVQTPETKSAPYEVYVPPKQPETRAGSSDALAIKSKGNA